MIFLSRNATGIFLTLILAGCCFREPAADPERYAAPSACCSWERCHEEPLDKCLLMESADCEECPQSGVEGSLDLAGLLDTALKRSPSTRETWATARFAAARWGSSRARLYPELEFDAFWQALREPNFFGQNQIFIDEFREFGPYLNLSYLLFDFGTVRSYSQFFYQSLQEANWSHNREIQDVIKTVTIDYYTLIADREKVTAGEANLRDAETTLEATRAKHRFGISDITDVFTAETQVARERIVLLSDEQSAADAKATLLADAGLPANTCTEITGIEETIGERELLESVNHFVCAAYDARPDLRAAYARVVGFEHLVDAAEKNQLPKVNFQGNIGESRFNGSDRAFSAYSAQLSFTYPLFAGWRYMNEIREAKALLERSKAHLRQTEVDMVKEVVQSYQDFNYATEIVIVSKEYVALAEKTFNARLSEYKTGTVDITTVVNSQTSLANARYSLADARKNWFDSLAQLMFATGVVTKPCCPGGLCERSYCSP